MMRPISVDTREATPQACFPRELVASSAFLLGRLGVGIKEQMFETFERAGFNPYHYSVLALLDEAPRTTQVEIADALRLDRSQLVGLLDGLEERNLIERRRDPSDRRRHLVSLTPDGKRQLQSLRKLVKWIEGEIFAPLDPEERAQLHDLLLRVAGHRDPRFLPLARSV